MKKLLVVVLAVLLAMSTMPMTVFATSDANDDFGFIGFDVKKDENGKGVVVDLERKIVYGFDTAVQVKNLSNYLEKGAGLDDMYVCANGKKLGGDDYIGTGSQIVLKEDGVEYPFDVVIFGDVNGDSVCDVFDAMVIANETTFKADFEADDAARMAVKTPETLDDEISEKDYQNIVNDVVSEAVDQNKGENANIVESIVVEDQIYTGDKITIDGDDVEILFNEESLSQSHYQIVPDSYVTNIDPETGKETVSVTLEGKGLFGGTITVEFEVIGLIQSIVDEVNAVIADAKLDNIVEVVYTNNADVDDIDIVINASNAIRGNFDVNMAAFNGLLAKIDEYRADKLEGLNLTVDNFALASNGSFSRGDVKNFVFDLASGIFCELAYAKTNTIKSYSGAISTTKANAEAFNIDLMVKEDVAGDINRIKNFSAKIARYVSFDVVNGNAVINVAMPAAFSAKVVDILSNGTGDVDAAAAAFNNLLVYEAFTEYLANVSTDDISAGAADEINQAIKVAAMLSSFVNKGLAEVADATVTSNVKTMPLLSGRNFVIDETNTNKFGALVLAFAGTLSQELLESSVADFYKDGIYTLAADVELEYKGIKETIIVNLDLFTAAEETPTIIEETATYFSGIVEDLGLNNAVTVSYDKDNYRALATLDARELVTNFNINEAAFDGLYTDIKGYFDDNYGTSTIVVDGKKIVTAGAINKSALKELIFSVATGFFQDAANLGANNVLRSLNTVVTEGDGTVHNFDLDFALVGSDADIERVAKIADKVADYVSFEVVNGNAVVNVGVPAGMRAKIINLVGDGDAAKAADAINNLYAYELITEYIMAVEPADISAEYADEIQVIVDMVANVDTIINKVMGKVSSSSVAYDAKGNQFALLSGNEFVVKNNTLSAVVEAVASQFSEGLLKNPMANFMNEDGTYTIVCDIALEIGGIKETVVLNLDVFGDYEKKNAIEDTVDYAESIFADLGVASFASVELKDGKAVATFDASAFLADGLKSFNEAALDGLYTDVKDYFYANFGDSTITVGNYEIVTAGEIKKSALKSFVFDFAAGFFTDVANMDTNTIRSYNTVVVDSEGNEEVFAFDFNLDGTEAHIEKLKTIAGKVAECVAFETVDGNAVATISLPDGMKNKVIDLLSNGTGDVEAAKAAINNLYAYELISKYIMAVEPSDISVDYADEIQTIINMVADMESVINKVMGKVSASSVAYDAKGNEFALLSGIKFAVKDNTMSSLVEAVASQFSEELLRNSMANFMNEDGTYTIKCDIALEVGGIKETVVVNFDLF